MVKDIYPGSGSSSLDYLTNVNGTLFFSAYDDTNGYELWKSNGTAAGTVMVKDIYPGSGSSSLDCLTDVNGTLFFSADDGISGVELWKSNGTEAGTVMVKNISGNSGSNPYYLTNVNGTLFFNAYDDTSGDELWKSNGTEVGTVMVKDIYPGAGGSSPYYLTDVNGTLFFSAYDDTNGCELWKSNGTEAGTVMVKDIYPGSGSSSLDCLTDVNGTLFFNADDGTYGCELWMYMYILNDECEDALGVSLGQVHYGSNYGADGNDLLTSCAYNDFADVWFYYTPQVGGRYTVSAGSSDFDTTLAVFSACGGDELACNDDYSLQTTDSQVSLNMVKGKRYYIRVAGFNGESGNYWLVVDAGACTKLAVSDLNGDCVVDFLDFAIMASEWLSCNLSPPDLCW
jgi:ELWxxDGT repeat protein